MMEGDRTAVPRQRQMAERDWTIAGRFAKCKREIIESQAPVRRRDGIGARVRCTPSTLRRARIAGELVDQALHNDIGISGEQDIDGRQHLIVHAPAMVQRVIERCMNDRRRSIAASFLERSAEIDPIKAHDDIGAGDRSNCVTRQHDARCSEMQSMISRKRRAHFEIGEDARAEALREAHARLPHVFAS